MPHGKLFGLVRLSPSLEPVGDVALSISYAELLLASDPGRSLAQSLQFGSIGKVESVMFIDIGQSLAASLPALELAVQFNTSSGVFMFLCRDAQQKHQLAAQWRSLDRFLKAVKPAGPPASVPTTPPSTGPGSGLGPSQRAPQSPLAADSASQSPESPASPQPETLDGVVRQLQSFASAAHSYRTKLVGMEAAMHAKTTQLQTITHKFRELEDRNTVREAMCIPAKTVADAIHQALLRQVNDAQTKNMEIIERFRRLEQLHLASSEKLAALHYRLDDRVAVLEEKQKLLKTLETRLSATKQKSTSLSLLLYFVALPILAAFMTHYLLLLRSASTSSSAD
ncbi:hypothetical protein HK105_204664 [Polyrhizophydium stewartii]|uniref:Uncharacterized protein n=1 Tax=Polyrhizophydium stewartii TaxID=2732419 RepID=A0ABR4N868_9FUNG